MPWMLLDRKEHPPGALQSERESNEAGPPPGEISPPPVDDTSLGEPSPEQPRRLSAAPTYDAWILTGSLPVALAEVGVVEVLVEELQAPRSVYGAGLAAVAGLLARERSAFDVRTAFEELRADRLIPRALLPELPIVGQAAAHRCPWAESRITRLATREAGRPDLYVFAGERFVATTADGRGKVEANPAAALFVPVDELAALDAALIATVERRFARVLIIASAATLREPACRETIARAGEAGCQVTLLPVEVGRQVPPHHYLLPIWGTVERLVERGRIAARTWLRERSDSLGEVSARMDA